MSALTPSAAGHAPLRLAIVLLPSCNAQATTAFLDPLRAANYLAGRPLFVWDFLSLDSEPVMASNGMTFAATTALSAARRDATLVVVSASWTPEVHGSPTLRRWLKACDRRGATLVALDTGAIVLAAAGLLDGHAATVHYEHLAAFREQFPAVRVSEALYVLDRERWSCAGGAAAADMALELVRSQHSADLANAAARYIFHDRLRSPTDRQRPAPREPIGQTVPEALQRAIALMTAHLEEPLSLAKLASRMRLSQRKLERLFRAHTGVSPVRYYLDARLDRARGLMTQTDMSVLAIATACGFRASYFARIYKARFGLSPRQDRVVGRIPFQFREFPLPAESRNGNLRAKSGSV